MDFEHANVGTTGVASDGNNLYIATNNSKITIIDRVNGKQEVPHTFLNIEYLFAGPIYLSGIYVNDRVNLNYGIFIMNLETKEFTNKQVDYYPTVIKVKYTADNQLSIFTLDKYWNAYMYDAGLNLSESYVSGSNYMYNTTDYVLTDGASYAVINKQIFMSDRDIDPVVETTIQDDILATIYYLDALYIIYKTSVTQYSILKYDLTKNVVVKTIMGGYSIEPVYACIHRNNIYVSTSVNKIFSLSLFDPPGTVLPGPSPVYSIFGVNETPVEFIDASLNINPTRLKERKDSLSVDTLPAKTTHFYYYIWLIIAIVLMILIWYSFVAREKGTLNIVILVIILVTLFFILRTYI